MNNLGLSILIPESIVLLTILIIIILDLLQINQQKIWLISIIGLSSSLLSLLTKQIGFAFGTSFESTYLNLAVRGLILLSSILCILFTTNYIKKANAKLNEYICILLTATLGSLLMTGANDLIFVFVALETLGLSSYLMTAYITNDLKSNEAAIKYLVIGAVSTSCFLYGLTWVYGLSGGEVEFHRISASLETMDLTKSSGILISLGFVIIGLGFKISAVPFHQWTPDVYEGAPAPVTAFLSVISKIAGLILLIRLLNTIYVSQTVIWQYILQCMSIGSMIVGNILALNQTSLKRMLGYSSIAQIGFLLIGIFVNNPTGYVSSLTYLYFYLFMNLGAFACIILLGSNIGSDSINDYVGLFTKNPILALSLSICLISLAGIPPSAGFFGKIYLFISGWESGYYNIVIIGLITSVLSIAYYLRVVQTILVTEPVVQKPYVVNSTEISFNIGLTVCIIGTLVLGFVSNFIINFFQNIILMQ